MVVQGRVNGERVRVEGEGRRRREEDERERSADGGVRERGSAWGR